jgi:cysteine desulfurase
VVLTSGGTEANNLALHDAPGVVTSRIEHPSVVRVAESLERRGVPVHWLPVPASGALEVAAVEAALLQMPQGSVVAVMAVNHETGVIQPVAAIAERVRAAGALLHVDAVQGLGKIDPACWQGAHSIAVAAHKIRGPKGIGALVWKQRRSPQPLLLGGSQERGLRAGTQDAALAAAFSAALQHAERSLATRAGLAALRERVEQGLAAAAEVNGGDAERVPHVSNLSFNGWRGAELAAALDLEGLQVSSGSACSAGTSEPSAVVAAMLGPQRAGSSVRFSLGELTQADDIEQAIAIVLRVLARRP